MIPDQDTTYLNKVLLEEGSSHMKLLPAAHYYEIDPVHLRLWCHKWARYGIVTEELIGFLKPYVVKGKTIEVAAGSGDLGYHLGIISTDSFIQQNHPGMKKYLEQGGQPPMAPGKNVRKYEAMDAIHKYAPQVVIASWLTQKYEEGDSEKRIGSSIYGPDEREIIEEVGTYIHIGNENVHGDKRALELPHTKTKSIPRATGTLGVLEPGYNIISRAKDPSKNIIYIWKK